MMRKVLYILGQLRDRDVTWLGEVGHLRQVASGEVLITEGRRNDRLFIVLAGRFEVRSGGQLIAELHQGEIIGELSFVDSAPPSASVIAGDHGEVLELDHGVVQTRLDAEPEFAAGFYRALAMFLADRLRSTVQRMGYADSTGLADDQVLADELDDGLLDQVSIAGDRFDRLFRMLSGRG